MEGGILPWYHALLRFQHALTETFSSESLLFLSSLGCDHATLHRGSYARSGTFDSNSTRLLVIRLNGLHTGIQALILLVQVLQFLVAFGAFHY